MVKYEANAQSKILKEDKWHPESFAVEHGLKDLADNYVDALNHINLNVCVQTLFEFFSALYVEDDINGEPNHELINNAYEPILFVALMGY